MTLAAHTQLPGGHTKYDIRTEFVRGLSYYSGEPFETVTDSYSIPVAYSYKPSPYHGDHRTAYDYSRSVRKVLADDPWVYREYNYNHEGWPEIDRTFTKYLSRVHGPFGYNPLQNLTGNAHAESVTRALENLHPDNLQFGASLGEGHKTAGMLVDTAHQLATALTNARKGNWGGVLKSLKMSPGQVLSGASASNRWLEYQYGWKPLIQDLHDAVVQVCSPNRSGIIKAVGSGRVDKTFTFPYADTIQHVTCEVRSNTTLFARVTSPALDRLNGLGLVNPLSVAWELTPFSFVLDWFIPVGSVLEALTAGFGLEPLGGWTSDRSSYTITISKDNSHDVSYGSSGYETLSPGHYQEAGYDFVRTAYSTFPVPQLFADTTPWTRYDKSSKSEQDNGRAVNALALVRQLR